MPRLAPPFVVTLWVGVLCLGVAIAALGAAEPPVWDSLSYFVKAKTFWQNIAAGVWVNPFDVNMTVRPPGTILMSYPFGFSDDFRWFYFRSVAIPLVLLVIAVYVAADTRTSPPTVRWMQAGLAMALAGQPMLYQFQITDDMASVNTWGRVDNFMAGVAALAMACLCRSIARLSWGWAAFGAFLAALSFTIKPAGAVVMALAGVAWLVLLCVRCDWNLRRFLDDVAMCSFALRSLAAAVIIYVATLAAAANSEYFSPENIAFGSQAMKMMAGELPGWIGFESLALLFRLSVGVVIPIVIVVGLGAAARQRESLGYGLAAFLCIVGGIWFWIYTNGSTEIRYFVPFLAMALVALVPHGLARAGRMQPLRVYIGTGVLALPTVFITVLLFLPHAPKSWQSLAGVNLNVAAYAPERQQFQLLLDSIKKSNTSPVRVYLFDASSNFRNIVAVADYANVTDPTLPQILMTVPMDWTGPRMHRFENMATADYIAFEPIKDLVEVAWTIETGKVGDFYAQNRLMLSRFTMMTEADGVAVVSETSIRLLKVIDRSRFEATLNRMLTDYKWPAEFLASNPQRWWTEPQLAQALANTPPITANLAFRATSKPAPAITVRAATVERLDEAVRIKVWLRDASPDFKTDKWLLFAHLVDARGEILSNKQIDPSDVLAIPVEGADIRLYTLDFPFPDRKAAAIAFGFYAPGKSELDYLTTEGTRTDWGGVRVLLPLPPAP